MPANLSFQEECPHCGGTGRITKATRTAASRKGGNAVVLKRGRQHMADIGKKGGRPRALTLADVQRSG